MAPEEPGPPRASRLAGAGSLYLRSAAAQPIDWYPWGPEPFEVARRTGRPVLLDVGASWCHWCHVMDEGTYDDAEVGRLLRQHFVAVKVDRDELPEVDRRYQRQVSALSGEGGWPLTAFLTPDGEAFFGGTYFPPSDEHGRPGFRRLLREIARLWTEEPAQVRDHVSRLRESLVRLARAPAGRGSAPSAFAERVVQELRSSFDPAYAGFGTSPKFPHPTAVALLLWDEHHRGDAASGRQALETLRAMADGGLYDQLGGGFHRYSVDEAWRIPHFEKMAVDNAELLGAYVDGYRRFGEPRLEEIVRGVVGWASGVLEDPEGGWGASQDADNAPGDDGGYFTWTRTELRDALGPEEARFVSRVFGVGTEGRMPHDADRNVLFRLLPPAEAAEGIALDLEPAEALARASARLLEARNRRPAPQVDRALYASVNGRFIGAYAAASGVFGEPRWLGSARRAADRWIREGLDVDRGVAHRLGAPGPRGFGLLDDQVSLARGLVELAVASGEVSYLAHGVRLLEIVDREFRGEDGLLRDVAARLYDGAQVGPAGEASYSLEDSPHLGANSAAALAFGRLGTLLHDDRWRDRARGLVAPLSSRLAGAGVFAAGAALAAGLLETPPVQVVVEGGGPPSEELLSAARRAWHPNSAVFRGVPPPPFSLPAETPGGGIASGSRAIVCFERSCAPPVTDASALSRLVRAGRPSEE